MDESRTGRDEPTAQESPADPPAAPGLGHRLRRALGPLLPGLVIDGLDLLTFGPAAPWVGPLVGAPAGWFLARGSGLGRTHSGLVAVACGVYCALPFTTALPLATMIGAWARFVLAGRPADP